MKRQERSEISRRWRLDELEIERKRVVLTRHYRSEEETQAQVAELEGLIRAERIRLGIDETEAFTFDWNEAVFYCFVVVFAVAFVMGVAALMFGGWE